MGREGRSPPITSLAHRSRVDSTLGLEAAAAAVERGPERKRGNNDDPHPMREEEKRRESCCQSVSTAFPSLGIFLRSLLATEKLPSQLPQKCCLSSSILSIPVATHAAAATCGTTKPTSQKVCPTLCLLRKLARFFRAKYLPPSLFKKRIFEDEAHA